jgi:hypothetical protein
MRCGRFGGKFALPSSDKHAREAIAEHVYGSSSHVHQLIDCKEQEERLGWQME